MTITYVSGGLKMTITYVSGGLKITITYVSGGVYYLFLFCIATSTFDRNLKYKQSSSTDRKEPYSFINSVHIL
jgi:Zn/Cd-binding protein ZinT